MLKMLDKLREKENDPDFNKDDDQEEENNISRKSSVIKNQEEEEEFDMFLMGEQELD